MPPKYKYHFFKNLRARGEFGRLLFVAAGVEYEDVRVERYGPEWEELKPTMPGGTLPVLEFNGEKFGESVVIARYLAREFGLDGKTSYEMLLTDSIVERIIQIREFMSSFFFLKDEEKKAAAEKVFNEEKLPAALSFIEKFGRENKSRSGFLVGDKLTWADLGVFDIMEHIVAYKPNILDGYPNLAAHFKLVRNLPRLSRYLDERPVSVV